MRKPAIDEPRPPYHPRSHARRVRGEGLLGLREASAMAIGGMIGGGIFSVLGLTIDLAGHLAFAAFLIGGLIAGLTAHAYAGLSLRAGRAGGPFIYLRDEGHTRPAAWVAWLLILGYVFALAVYAFTFGHYLANVIGAPATVARLSGVGILAVFVAVNLRGVATSGLTEDIVVVTKLAVLGGVALIGLAAFSPTRLSPLDNQGTLGIFLGAAVIFVAYEGFELLPYDYDDIAEPRRTLPRALYLSVAVVVLVYVAVTLAAQMLLPDRTITAQKEVAFALAGEAGSGRLRALGGDGGRPVLHQFRDKRDAVRDRPLGPRREPGKRASGRPRPRARRPADRRGARHRAARGGLLALTRNHRNRLLRLAGLSAGLRVGQPAACPAYCLRRVGPGPRLPWRRRLLHSSRRAALLPGSLRSRRIGVDRRLRGTHRRGPGSFRGLAAAGRTLSGSVSSRFCSPTRAARSF